MRVLIVCESASAGFGGEAALPLHYFRVLQKFAVPVWMVTHARTRDELVRLFPSCDTIHYVEDSRFHRLMWRLGTLLPARLSNFTLGYASRVATQLESRRIARRLVRDLEIDIVHQPMPVSPKEPSLLFGLGCPVVIGPMNGGMTFPPGFRRLSSFAERLAMRLGGWSASALNRLMPGKRKAALLLVANERTRLALPETGDRRVAVLVENGVDLELWRDVEAGTTSPTPRPTTFVYMGRLVDWKAVDLLLEALRDAIKTIPMTLVVIGDGPERHRLERLTTEFALPSGSVTFSGWLPQSDCASRLRAADCLVLPSLYECGGAVVLEAMAVGRPVIASDWGGPADYLDPSCGILVSTADRATFVGGLRDALIRIASSPDERVLMGRNGAAKVRAEYDWDHKVRRMLAFYRDACRKVAP